MLNSHRKNDLMRNRLMKNNHGKNNHRKNNHQKNNHTKNNNRENRMSLGALCLSLVLVLGACGQAQDAAEDRGAQAVAQQSQTTETADIREVSPENEHNGHSVVTPEADGESTTESSRPEEEGGDRGVGEETPEASETDSSDAGLTPEPTKMPQEAETPRQTVSPQPAEMPETTVSPQPTKTPRPTETPGPTVSPQPVDPPQPTKTPRPAETQQPTKTPQPSGGPGAGASEPESSLPPEGGVQEPEQDRETPSSGTPAETEESHCLTEADHEYRKIYWYGTASCGTETNFYNLECIKCGHVGGSGTDIIPHTPVETVTTEKDCCTRNEITESVCGVCGMYLGRSVRKIGEEHSWVTGEGPVVWNEQTHSFEHKTVVYCSVCLQEQDAANP